MKKLFIGMIALALGAGAAHAQEAPPQKPMDHPRHRESGSGHEGHGRDQMLSKKLNFSDQQKQQLKDINQQYHQQLADLHKNLDITVREQRTRMAAIHKDHQQQIQNLFTPEQKAQLQKMKDERQEMAKVNAKARAEKMKIKLGLSDEQAQKLKDLRTATFTKIKDIRSNESLSADQKREKMKAIVQDQKQQLKSVLTPDQLKQLDEMHHGDRRREWTK